MQYLYHHLPYDLKGTTLYPLNDLKFKLPDTYHKEVSKYAGRESVMEQRIPLLNNCLWNDVIFLTAVHPQDIFDARRKAGWSDLEPQRYLRIDPHTLDSSKLCIYLFKVKENGLKTGLDATDFVSYDYKTLEKYSKLPDATKQYFQQEHDRGEQLIRLFYRYVPHVLYRGDINIVDADSITVQ